MEVDDGGCWLLQEARDGKAGKIEDKGKIYLVNVEIPF
jgi:hypothetical protein